MQVPFFTNSPGKTTECVNFHRAIVPYKPMSSASVHASINFYDLFCDFINYLPERLENVVHATGVEIACTKKGMQAFISAQLEKVACSTTETFYIFLPKADAKCGVIEKAQRLFLQLFKDGLVEHCRLSFEDYTNMLVKDDPNSKEILQKTPLEWKEIKIRLLLAKQYFAQEKDGCFEFASYPRKINVVFKEGMPSRISSECSELYFLSKLFREYPKGNMTPLQLTSFCEQEQRSTVLALIKKAPKIKSSKLNQAVADSIDALLLRSDWKTPLVDLFKLFGSLEDEAQISLLLYDYILNKIGADKKTCPKDHPAKVLALVKNYAFLYPLKETDLNCNVTKEFLLPSSSHFLHAYTLYKNAFKEGFFNHDGSQLMVYALFFDAMCVNIEKTQKTESAKTEKTKAKAAMLEFFQWLVKSPNEKTPPVLPNLYGAVCLFGWICSQPDYIDMFASDLSLKSMLEKILLAGKPYRHRFIEGKPLLCHIYDRWKDTPQEMVKRVKTKKIYDCLLENVFSVQCETNPNSAERSLELFSKYSSTFFGLMGMYADFHGKESACKEVTRMFSTIRASAAENPLHRFFLIGLLTPMEQYEHDQEKKLLCYVDVLKLCLKHPESALKNYFMLDQCWERIAFRKLNFSPAFKSDIFELHIIWMHYFAAIYLSSKPEAKKDYEPLMEQIGNSYHKILELLLVTRTRRSIIETLSPLVKKMVLETRDLTHSLFFFSQILMLSNGQETLKKEPEEWIQFITSCKGKEGFNLEELIEHLKSIEDLKEDLEKTFMQYMK